MERMKLIGKLLQLFSTKLNETLQPFHKVSEKVDYLESLIEYIGGVYHHVDAIPHLGWEGNPFDSRAFIRKNILARFKDKAKPFTESRLHLYLEKEPDYKTQLFQLLETKEPILNEQEFEIYIKSVNRIIQELIEKAWTDISEDDDTDVSNETIDSNGYSRSRQVLMLHYLLEITRLGRNTNSLPIVAEFAHAMFGLPTKNFKTSSLQKMFKNAPGIKTNDVNMIQDLEFVKAKFSLIGSVDAVALIQKEINRRT